MTVLSAIQHRFKTTVTGGEESGILDWPFAMRDGMNVYRSAYRARLTDCLRDAFDKSRRWIGDESFDAAAAHHLILHPPASWTLDDLGVGFSDTLASLFPGDPEVEELAWLEWEMQRLFTGPDTPILSGADFAWRASAFAESDWLDLRLDFIRNMVVRVVTTDCAALWTAIENDAEMPPLSLPGPDRHLLVWHHQLRSHFRLIDDDEATGLALMRGGASFEQLCDRLVRSRGDEDGVAAAGTMLGRWMTDGLVATIGTVHD